MALSGKVALITGAAQGLGKAYSEILLKNGAKVAVVDINEKEGKSLKETFDKQFGPDRTLLLTCNVESEEQFKGAFQETIKTFGRIDIVCNNAGINNEKEWVKTISINLNGVVRGTYLALEHMNKLTGGQGGVIINISSLAGIVPIMNWPAYTAAKFGVVGFSRAMANASAACGFGVRINMLCPGPVRTDMLIDCFAEDRKGQFIQSNELPQKMEDMGEVMENYEVAENFLQLVIDDTRNGEALAVKSTGSCYVTFPTLEMSLSPR